MELNYDLNNLNLYIKLLYNLIDLNQNICKINIL